MGKIDLNPLTEFGQLTVHPVTSPKETQGRLRDTTIVITNKVLIDAAMIESSAHLKLICIAATGTNCVDLKAAQQAGIPVCAESGNLI